MIKPKPRKNCRWRNYFGNVRGLKMSERAKEINEFSPSSLSHIVGQTSVVQQVRVAIDAAFEDNRKMDSCLLVGPPGLGKSALAKTIAAELATDFYEVLGQSIASPSDLNAVLLQAKHNSVVHIDEGHLLKKEFQTALYLAIDQRKLILSGGKQIESLPIADFSLLISSTDEYCLLQPLRDRMRLILRFEFYTEDELTIVLRHRAKCLRWEIHEEVPPLIARRSRGTPRIALRLLQSCYRVCRSLGETTITMEHLQRACSTRTDRRTWFRAKRTKISFDSRQRSAESERHRIVAWLAGTNN